MFNPGDIVEFIKDTGWGYVGNRFYVMRFDEESGMYFLGPMSGFEVLVSAKPDAIRKASEEKSPNDVEGLAG